VRQIAELIIAFRGKTATQVELMRAEYVNAETTDLLNRGPGLRPLIGEKTNQWRIERDGGEGSYDKAKSSAFRIPSSDDAYSGGIGSEDVPESARIELNVSHAESSWHSICQRRIPVPG